VLVTHFTSITSKTSTWVGTRTDIIDLILHSLLCSHSLALTTPRLSPGPPLYAPPPHRLDQLISHLTLFPIFFLLIFVGDIACHHGSAHANGPAAGVHHLTTLVAILCRHHHRLRRRQRSRTRTHTPTRARARIAQQHYRAPAVGALRAYARAGGTWGPEQLGAGARALLHRLRCRPRARGQVVPVSCGRPLRRAPTHTRTLTLTRTPTRSHGPRGRFPPRAAPTTGASGNGGIGTGKKASGCCLNGSTGGRHLAPRPRLRPAQRRPAPAVRATAGGCGRGACAPHGVSSV